MSVIARVELAHAAATPAHTHTWLLAKGSPEKVGARAVRVCVLLIDCL
jgi:hypothetical protein